ncbi:hypothetical protein KM043_009803 [Ampulex compressa]|nr:hypothetical protein KM043_009803 [Ampulex compressa]
MHKDAQDHDVRKIRNIGILAHIDAGKTTTTERMLFYSGLIKNMGEVHHGNTVTDYMDQERERGITITSAAVTFDWKNHRINLIDTPGHIDFTMQVEQTLRVLDGAVVILDGSAGVEAQTLTVCKQADKYKIPRIIYVNKMDRQDADFDMNIESIQSKLNIEPLAIQFPLREKRTLTGIVDVITLEKLIFDTAHRGYNVTRSQLSESTDSDLWRIANEKRRILIDKLSALDDKIADLIIEQESLDKVSSSALAESLRRVTIRGKGVPVLLGSSYKNVGVQPLMTGIILYLPSPNMNPLSQQYKYFEDNLCARVFKIIHDKQRGATTLFRIYNGTMKKGEKIYNIQRDVTELSKRLYVACANEFQDISEISNGNIAAATGLQSTITEPPSLSAQTSLEIALQELQREDPSLIVTHDEETEQTILAGMGELHIDIIKERIKKDYKIDVDLGPLQIAYRTTIQTAVKDTYVAEHKIGNTSHKVTVTMSVIPNYEGTKLLLLDHSREYAAHISTISTLKLQAVKKGVKAALLHGPKLSYPVINVGVKLHYLETQKGTSLTIISAAVSQCILKLLQAGNITLMEPIMHLEIVVDEQYSSKILADLSKRRSEIQQITLRGSNKVFETLTPLSELLGYSTTLRIITSGHGTFSSEFSHYQLMDAASETEAIQKITGV